MTNLGRGVIAGFLATVVLSALIMMNSTIGLMPELNVIRMFSGILGRPDNLLIGWVAHFVIGAIVWGGLFASLESRLPTGMRTTRGIIFGIGAWLLIMVVIMPMGGAGLFGLQLGPLAPALTLALLIVFGAVLGWVYGELPGRTSDTNAG